MGERTTSIPSSPNTNSFKLCSKLPLGPDSPGKESLVQPCAKAPGPSEATLEEQTLGSRKRPAGTWPGVF